MIKEQTTLEEVFDSLHERVVEISDASNEPHIKAELAVLALELGLRAATNTVSSFHHSAQFKSKAHIVSVA